MSVYLFSENFFATSAALLIRDLRTDNENIYKFIDVLIENNFSYYEKNYNEQNNELKENLKKEMRISTKNLDFLNFLTNKNLELYIQDLNNFINNSNKDQKGIEILNSLYSRLIEKLIDKNIINFNIKRA